MQLSQVLYRLRTVFVIWIVEDLPKKFNVASAARAVQSSQQGFVLVVVRFTGEEVARTDYHDRI